MAQRLETTIEVFILCVLFVYSKLQTVWIRCTIVNESESAAFDPVVRRKSLFTVGKDVRSQILWNLFLLFAFDSYVIMDH